MLKPLQKRNESGFTIIEVLIVLAIAGLILLVVFLAVPALQRSQRNSARRSEASRIAAAANDFLTNSQGNVPSSASDATNILNSAGVSSTSNLAISTGAGGAACAAGTVGSSTGKLTICTVPSAGVSFTTLPTSDAAVLGTAATCNGSSGFSSGTTRQMALIYTLESGGSSRTLACIST